MEKMTDSMTIGELKSLLAGLADDEIVKVVYQSALEVKAEDGDVLEIVDRGYQAGVGHVLYVGADV